VLSVGRLDWGVSALLDGTGFLCLITYLKETPHVYP